MAVKLGSRVKDSITGFTGIAVGYSRWMYGCNRIVVEGESLKDGKPLGNEWFDEQRIQTIEADVVPVVKPQKHKIIMGNLYRDTVTGFEGVAQAVTEWSSGNVTISIEPTKLEEDGKPVPAQGFDVHRLTEVTKKEIPVSEESVAKTGGPQRDPVQAM